MGLKGVYFDVALVLVLVTESGAQAGCVRQQGQEEGHEDSL